MNEAKYTDKLIDLNYLKQLSFNDTAFEHAVIRQFILQVPEELELLKEAIHKKNLRTIKSIAHSLKSSIAYLGLTDRLYTSLDRIEAEAASNTINPHFNEDFEQVEKVCRQAVQEAIQFLNVSVNLS
jgi:HPt (histidine-containing phosphotransfer) domain-containing protein